MRSFRAVGVLAVLTAACGSGSPAVLAPPTTAPAVTAPAPAPPSVPPTTTTQPPAVWKDRAPAPTARQEVASTVAQGRIWVIGGLTAAGATALVESYDPTTDRWAAGPALPLALHHAAATTYQGEIVVAGGFVAAPGTYDRASDRVLALRGGVWVDLPRLRRPRGAAAAAAVGDYLVLAGGRNDVALIGPTEVFDGTGWHDAAAIPTRRDHLSAVSDGRSMFTVGGRFLSAGALSAAFERYDPVANAWERLPALPTARAGQGAAVTASGRIVVIGGEDPSGVYAEVEAYDVGRQTWATLPSLPVARHGLAVERVGTQVLALVGGTAYGVAPSTAAEALGPVS